MLRPSVLQNAKWERAHGVYLFIGVRIRTLDVEQNQVEVGQIIIVHTIAEVA